MNRNPYTPPEANVDDPAAMASDPPAVWVRLYSPLQLAVAAFLGAPVAAAWFAASNFRALAQPLKARRTMLWGIVATAVIMGIAFVLPDGFPNVVLPVAYSVAIRAMAEPLFGAIVENHRNAGGTVGSWWRIVGVSLLLLAGVLAGLVAIVVLLTMLGILKE